MKELSDIDFRDLREDLITNFNDYREAFFSTGFAIEGPPVYFHTRTLKTQFPENIELIYATLVSWGMHRMGSGGAKMVCFTDFEKSLQSLELVVTKLKKKLLKEINDEDLTMLETIFKEINVTKSNAFIVPHSKVMAHLLPDIIPPFDRLYTLDFFSLKNSYQSRWRKGRDGEWELFKRLIVDFFQPLTNDVSFQEKSKEYLHKTPWDSSIPKIIDNLIIGKGKVKAKSLPAIIKRSSPV